MTGRTQGDCLDKISQLILDTLYFSAVTKKSDFMLPFLPIFTLAQAAPAPQTIVQPQEVRALPGQLDLVPMFNSNSPEVIQTEGILLSTFHTVGKHSLISHLNYAFEGRFDFFAHHIARSRRGGNSRTLYLGAIVYNPSDQPVTIDILQAVSYVTNPDAPFINLPPYVENPAGRVYSGPGSRLTNDILRGVRQADFPAQMVIPPRQSQMLLNLPIPSRSCRSTLMRLQSSGRVYVASLAMYAPLNASDKNNRGTPSYRAPSLEEWQRLLDNGTLVFPRDRLPTPPAWRGDDVIYGRVAGVALGSEWQAQLVDSLNGEKLSIPQRGQAFSYPISTVSDGTLGTGQVQSAPMLVRYSDTAYSANGNYAVHYRLTLPLHNPTGETQTVTVAIQTPFKEEQLRGGLRFRNPPEDKIFFRGTVEIKYQDDTRMPQTRYVHLVQRRGQQGEPLVTLTMPPNDRRTVDLEFIYPPDSTPPQVVTVKTQE